MDPNPVPSLYAELQLTPEASPDEVRQAYRRLAQQHHPDRAQDGEDPGEAMARINRAYKVLSDPHQRTEYDFKRRVAATREARGRRAGAGRMGGKHWLILWAVITLTVLVLGWVAYRILAPKPAGTPALASQPAGPVPEEPLLLIPARSIEPWTPPQKP